jgi:hypothetical protein
MPSDLESLRKVLDSMWEGYTLCDALQMHGVTRKYFYKMKAEVPQIGEEYLRARESTTDLDADECKRIADNEAIDPHRARNMINARQWLAAKRNPRQYGERMDVSLNQTIDMTAALLEAKRRVLSLRDPDEVEDAQVVEPAKLSHDGATGQGPVDPVPAPAGEESSDENS